MEHTFFVIVFPNLVPFWRADSGLLIHALSFASSINRGSSRVVTMSTTHGRLAHVIAECEALREVACIECGFGRWGVFVLRGMRSQRSFGIGSQSIVIRHAILRANMLKNLLVYIEL